MTLFDIEAIDKRGKRISFQIEAESRHKSIIKCKEKGLLILALKEVKKDEPWLAATQQKISSPPAPEIDQTSSIVTNSTPNSDTKVTVPNFFQKILSGFFGAAVGISIGILLCFIPFVGFIGYFFILVGILFPFVAPFLDWTTLTGGCPWCGAEVNCDASKKGVDCPVCKNRIVIKDKRFIKIE